MALTLTFDESKNQIKANLHWTQKKYRDDVESYMVQKAEELEQYMKSNHPWRNRTGAAERGLSAKLSSSKMRYTQRIDLMHGVPYGVYLEYSMGRRYAILEPTMRLKGPDIVNGLRGKLGMFVKVKKV